MKLKQQNLKVFEITIDDEEQFKTYLTKNAPLLQGHLLALTNIPSKELSEFLHEKNFCFVSTKTCVLNSRKRSNIKAQEELNVKSEAEVTSVKKESEKKVLDEKMILHRPIRSGETIETKGDIVVFGRINSGSRLSVNGNGEFFDIIDGTIDCHGDYLILKSIGKGSVIFKSETIKKEQLKGSLHLVIYKDGIVIREIA